MPARTRTAVATAEASDTSFEVTFAFEKETKNAVRYAELGRVTKIGTLYIQKHALPDGEYPPTVKLVVSFPEAE